MKRTFSGLRHLRSYMVGSGLVGTALGFWCLTEGPKRIILEYFSQDDILNPQTMAALILMGAFFVIFGWGLAAIGILWPDVLERAAALPRSELLFGASLFGTNILFFFALALGRGSMATYVKSLVILLAGTALFVVERKTGRFIARVYGFVFNRWAAFAGYVGASLYFLQLRFPFSTWNRFIFSRDYPMFQYTIWLDYKILKQGYLYGWEPCFSGGYPTFLNLRSLLLPYLPFTLFAPALGFHLMIAVTYVSVPFLCYLLAKELSGDRDAAVLSGWAGVGVMTGYMWHILNWGMMPTFTSLPFLMLALVFFVRGLKGSRWGIFLCAVFWAPLCYIHLGHFAHAAIALFIVALIWIWQERRLRAGFALAKATALAVLFGAPYLVEFFRFRNYIILNNFYSYPKEGMLKLLFRNVAHSIPTLQWHWSERFEAAGFADWGYLGLFTIFVPVVVYLVWSGERGHRRAGLLYGASLLVALLSFVPKFELSFQRMLYMVPPLMALALGFWCAEAKKRGFLVPFYVLILMLAFYNRVWIEGRVSGRPSHSEMQVAEAVAKTPRGHFTPVAGAAKFDRAIPTLGVRGEFDAEVVEAVAGLAGHYVLFENTASLDPHGELDLNWAGVEEVWDVHAPGFVRMATGRRLFSHPGYNPHPYYDLRGTYIATGTFDGKDLAEYEPAFFQDLFRKWGIEYLVLWTPQAKSYFGRDADYEKVLEGVHYAIYRFWESDTREVVTEGGEGSVEFPDNFTALVTLDGVEEGSRVVVRQNYFPLWRAECQGREVELLEAEGQMAFDAPAADCVVELKYAQHRGYFVVPLLALLVGIVLSVRAKL